MVKTGKQTAQKIGRIISYGERSCFQHLFARQIGDYIYLHTYPECETGLFSKSNSKISFMYRWFIYYAMEH